jgi:hypothetical protein
LLRGVRPMADYRPLLIRAISRLDANTPGARQSVYANARTTLEALLLLQDHTRISEDELDRERRALEDAIATVESRSSDTTVKPARSSTLRITDALTCVARPSGRETAVGRTEFLNDIREDTFDFRRLEHDPERRMEALAAIAAAVSQEIKDRSR